MSSDLELFNTFQFNQPNVQDVYINPELQINKIAGKDLKYPIPINKLPKNFDPRHPSTIPYEDVNKWFYKNFDGQLISVVGWPLDQAGCGSCWGFAASAVFTDAARLRMNQMYQEKACLNSPIFNLVFACVGDAKLVNGKPAHLYAVQDRNGFSPYYIVAFSPKQTIDSEGQPIIERVCEIAIKDWRDSLSSRKGPPDATVTFGSQFSLCQGCKGNSLENPLMLTCNTGVPLFSDYTIHDWACFFGNQEDRRAFCSNEYLVGDIVYKEAPNYKADKYSYVNIDQFKAGDKPEEIKSMSEWFMLSIYNYGPIMIGYSVFGSFLQFYRNPGNKDSIYTAEVFLNDIANQTGATRLGGHSVIIIGWGEVAVANSDGTTSSEPIKYWVVKNSWGADWGDGGYFRIERDIDQKLEKAGVSQRIQFENEFGALYFNPAPTSDLTNQEITKKLPDIASNTTTTTGLIQKDVIENKSNNPYNINDMLGFFQPHPNAKCLALGQFPEIIEKMTKDCSCRCGDSFNPVTKQCERTFRSASAPQPHAHMSVNKRHAGQTAMLSYDPTLMSTSTSTSNKKKSSWLIGLLGLLGILTLFLILFRYGVNSYDNNSNNNYNNNRSTHLVDKRPHYTSRRNNPLYYKC